MSADPAAVGRRLLEHLEECRRQAIANRRKRAAELAELVLRAARLDRAAGRPPRGRAARVVRRLALEGVEVSERYARKILGTDCPTVPNQTAESCSDASTEPSEVDA